MNLKKTVLVLLIGSLTIGACKKSTPVVKPVDPANIAARATIAAQLAKMTNADIVVTEAGVNKLKLGAVVYYKTNLGNYGKFTLVSAGDVSTTYLLTIDVITYKIDGSILVNKKGVTVQASYYCDLDTGTQTTQATKEAGDLWWDLNNTQQVFAPLDTTVFYVYSN